MHDASDTRIVRASWHTDYPGGVFQMMVQFLMTVAMAVLPTDFIFEPQAVLIDGQISAILNFFSLVEQLSLELLFAL